MDLVHQHSSLLKGWSCDSSMIQVIVFCSLPSNIYRAIIVIKLIDEEQTLKKYLNN